VIYKGTLGTIKLSQTKKHQTQTTNVHELTPFLHFFFKKPSVFHHKILVPTLPTPTPLITSLTQSFWEALVYQDFSKFELKLKHLFLKTRIDKHQKLFWLLKKTLQFSSELPDHVLGFKCVLKGKLSGKGNSRKKKITIISPNRKIDVKLKTLIQFSSFSKKHSFLLKTKTGVSTVTLYVSYIR